MDLVVFQVPKITRGNKILELVEGDVLKIEVNYAAGGGSEELDFTVPAGGAKIKLHVRIEEETIGEVP